MKKCEICSESNSKVLHKHHIVERTQAGTSNNPWNLALICSNCHMRVHAGEIEIVGVFPSTGLGGRTLVYKIEGKANIEGMEEEKPHFKSFSGMKIYS